MTNKQSYIDELVEFVMNYDTETGFSGDVVKIKAAELNFKTLQALIAENNTLHANEIMNETIIAALTNERDGMAMEILMLKHHNAELVAHISKLASKESDE